MRHLHPLIVPSTRQGVPVVYSIAYIEGGALVVLRLMDRSIHEDTALLLRKQHVACYYRGDLRALANQYFGGLIPLNHRDRAPYWHTIADNILTEEQEFTLNAYDPRMPMPDNIKEILITLLTIERDKPYLYATFDVEGAREPRVLRPVSDAVEERVTDISRVELREDADDWLVDASNDTLINGAMITFPPSTEAELVVPSVSSLYLTTYVRQLTFSPSEDYYEMHSRAANPNIKRLILSAIDTQQENHRRMLKAGSTQPKCNGDVEVGTAVRYRLQFKRDLPTNLQESLASRMHNSTMEPDGSGTWSERIFRVVKINEATETEFTTYELAQPDTAFVRGVTSRVDGIVQPIKFHRSDICPVNNIIIGAFVRIRLASNPRYRQQIEQQVRTGSRHTRYNHRFSRSIFEVTSTLLVGEEQRWFLTPKWKAGAVYPLAAWETDESQNTWSQLHYENREKVGSHILKGYLTTDLIRVDQQTSLKMETDDGIQQYTDCIKRIITRFPQGVVPQAYQAPMDDDAYTDAKSRLVTLRRQVAEYLRDSEGLDGDQDQGYLYLPAEQRGDTWLAVRCLLVTGSNLPAWTRISSAGRDRQMRDKKAEAEQWGTNKRQRVFTPAAMQWGQDAEQEARESYNACIKAESMNYEARPVDGMAINTDFTMSASPDGWVWEKSPTVGMPDKKIGAVEIKCPSGSWFYKKTYDYANARQEMQVTFNANNSFYTDPSLLETKKPEYYLQCIANLFAVPELQWIDFVVWTPPNGKNNVFATAGFKHMNVYRFTKSPELERKWKETVEAVSANLDSASVVKTFGEIYDLFVAKFIGPQAV